MLVGGSTTGPVYYLLNRDTKLKRGIHEDAVVALVDILLCDAIHKHASDIHFQPTHRALVIRYRIDGVLYDYQSLDPAQAPLLISRLKVLANLDIAERRVPQDGRMRAMLYDETVGERMIDFRLSTFPTLYGEKMVVRILDRTVRLFTLDSLGLPKTTHDDLQGLMARPHGLFLVTGPTGCGKTTTLYALINALNVNSKNIVTIEDPIEYELHGVTQSNINPKAGFTFENGLRALLRQDPDIIMIGEIRDKATAHIAIESALTGHLVLSTLHTNDASSAIGRLLEMGVEPFLLSATLIGVLSQRLARRLCAECRRGIEIDPAAARATGCAAFGIEKVFLPQGCSECHRLGYRGRIGIFELFMMNDFIRSLVMQRADARVIRQEAIKYGMQKLMHDGLEKVRVGLTTLEELLLLTHEESKGLVGTY